MACDQDLLRRYVRARLSPLFRQALADGHSRRQLQRTRDALADRVLAIAALLQPNRPPQYGTVQAILDQVTGER